MKLAGLPLLMLGLSGSAFAGNLKCLALYDEGSHYELSAAIQGKAVSGPLDFRYVTTDGIDLHATLSPKEQGIDPGQAIRLAAANESMAAMLAVTYRAASRDYQGTIQVTFDLEHAEPVELDAICTLN